MCHMLVVPVNTATTKGLHYEILCRPWEVVGADVFMINNKTLLCIVDYHSKFPIVKKVKALSADDLVQTTKLIFAEYGLPKKIVSDAGAKFTSEIFKDFYRQRNYLGNSYIIIPPQNSGLVSACIKFVKYTIKMP